MPLFIESKLIEDDYYLIGTLPEHRWYPVYCKPNKAKKLAEEREAATYAAAQR